MGKCSVQYSHKPPAPFMGQGLTVFSRRFFTWCFYCFHFVLRTRRQWIFTSSPKMYAVSFHYSTFQRGSVFIKPGRGLNRRSGTAARHNIEHGLPIRANSGVRYWLVVGRFIHADFAIILSITAWRPGSTNSG